MKYIKICTLLLGVSLNYLYASNTITISNDEPKIINDLLIISNYVNPNIVNLCHDLSAQGYTINYLNNDNIGIFLNNTKLIEIPLDCHQPTIQECSEWSGMQFTNTQYNDTIIDLYFNILGFADREYYNIFETNNKYKHIKFNNIKYSYPLFKIDGNDCFTFYTRRSLRNIIFTDPGKLLMYRLFLSSNYLILTNTIENDNCKILVNLGQYIVSTNYPIVITSSNYSKYSYNDNVIGISFNHLLLYCELQQNNNENFTKVGLTSRPVETSIYHELVHCFHHLYFNQLIYNNELNKLLYLFDTNKAIKQVFNTFCEYNNIKKVMDKQTLKTIFTSLVLYKGNQNALASNEEFATIIGIYPKSKYYYPGAELSENLFRFYTKLPIRDSHIHYIQDDYMQNTNFLNNVKDSIINLKLKYSNTKFYMPQAPILSIQYIPQNSEQNNTKKSQIVIRNISLVKYINKYNTMLLKGYNNCYFKTNFQEIINDLVKVSNTIDSYPKNEKLLEEDINNIIDTMYPKC